MILRGKTNISKLTVSDPMYDSKVTCRLSKILTKGYDWNVEVQLNKHEDAGRELLDIQLFVEREGNGPIFTKKEEEGFTFIQGLKNSTNFIGVDTATLAINDVEITTTADGKFGGFYVLTNPIEQKNFSKGLVGIQATIYLDDYCSCEQGFDLMNLDEVKTMLEHVFKTKFELIKEDNNA